MPLFLEKKLNEDIHLAVWKITESHDELFSLFRDRIHEEREHKNIHWIASRLLIADVIGPKKIELRKDRYNKPHLAVDDQPYYISISHSGVFAAVIIANKYPVAVDIEKTDERILRVKQKFARDDEEGYIDSDHHANMLTIIWSAKETLYKYYGQKELDFKTHLKIHPFSPSDDLIKGEIKKNSLHMNLHIHVETFDNYKLTYIY